MIKLTILKITVKLYPTHGAKKWATNIWHRNYKGKVLEEIESENLTLNPPPARTF